MNIRSIHSHSGARVGFGIKKHSRIPVHSAVGRAEVEDPCAVAVWGGVGLAAENVNGIATSDDVSKTLLSQVEAFFVSYNKQRGKKFKITGTGGPKKAIALLKAGIKERKREKEK